MANPTIGEPSISPMRVDESRVPIASPLASGGTKAPTLSVVAASTGAQHKLQGINANASDHQDPAASPIGILNPANAKISVV